MNHHHDLQALEVLLTLKVSLSPHHCYKMEDGTSALLESVTLKTLHAYNFSRTSSEASHVLTDLLSRYISLLAATCAQYAEHAGRSYVSPADIVSSLEELGVSVDELKDYCEGEGREMTRYTSSTARRMEELAVLKGHNLCVDQLSRMLILLLAFRNARRGSPARPRRRGATCVRRASKSKQLSDGRIR